MADAVPNLRPVPGLNVQLPGEIKNHMIEIRGDMFHQ